MPKSSWTGNWGVRCPGGGELRIWARLGTGAGDRGQRTASGRAAGFTRTAHPSRLLTWDSLSPRLRSGRCWGCRRRSLWAARPSPVSVGLVCKIWTRPHPRARPGPSPSWIVTSFPAPPAPVAVAPGGFQGQREDPPSAPRACACRPKAAQAFARLWS